MDNKELISTVKEIAELSEKVLGFWKISDVAATLVAFPNGNAFNHYFQRVVGVKEFFCDANHAYQGGAIGIGGFDKILELQRFKFDIDYIQERILPETVVYRNLFQEYKPDEQSKGQHKIILDYLLELEKSLPEITERLPKVIDHFSTYLTSAEKEKEALGIVADEIIKLNNIGKKITSANDHNSLDPHKMGLIPYRKILIPALKTLDKIVEDNRLSYQPLEEGSYVRDKAVSSLIKTPEKESNVLNFTGNLDNLRETTSDLIAFLKENSVGEPLQKLLNEFILQSKTLSLASKRYVDTKSNGTSSIQNFRSGK